MNNNRHAQREARERGNAVMEMALVVVFLTPILYGVFSIGMSLSRSVQAVLTGRDAGAMFMRSVDLAAPANQAILQRIASGLGLVCDNTAETPFGGTNGTGKLMLSQVTSIGVAECQSGGLTAATCPNYQHVVFVKYVVVGNRNLANSASPFGAPTSTLLAADGNIAINVYLTDSGARTSNFGTVLTLDPGDTAYVSESFFRNPDLDLPGWRDNSMIYQRNIF